MCMCVKICVEIMYICKKFVYVYIHISGRDNRDV